MVDFHHHLVRLSRFQLDRRCQWHLRIPATLDVTATATAAVAATSFD
jgi:hypothetical protein